jgi:hypothetical protein
MIRYTVMGAVLLAAVGAGRAHAQAVVEDPGYCAQYYPSANCQNFGPGNPMYPGSHVPSGYAAPGYYGAPGPVVAAAPVVAHHRRHHHYR